MTTVEKEAKPQAVSLKKLMEDPVPEEVVQMDTKRWKFSGNNREGVPVYIDKTTIYYPDDYVVRLWAATVRNNIKKVHLYEIGCLENEYRIMDKSSDKSALILQRLKEWTTIFPESTPELIYNAVCPKNVRLNKRLHQETETTIVENKSPVSEKEIQESKNIAKGIEPPAPEEEVQESTGTAEKVQPPASVEAVESAEMTTRDDDSGKRSKAAGRVTKEANGRPGT
jgi:hypothetical protein